MTVNAGLAVYERMRERLERLAALWNGPLWPREAAGSAWALPGTGAAARGYSAAAESAELPGTRAAAAGSAELPGTWAPAAESAALWETLPEERAREAFPVRTAPALSGWTLPAPGFAAEAEPLVAAPEAELQDLRSAARREAVNRFTTAEIKVDLTANNTVSREADLDGLVAYLGGALTDAMRSAAEGVHV